MAHLQEAKEVAKSSRSLDQERAQTYALIALAEAAQGIRDTLVLINSKLNAVLQQTGADKPASTEETGGEVQAEAEAVPKKTRRRAASK